MTITLIASLDLAESIFVQQFYNVKVRPFHYVTVQALDNVSMRPL